MPTLKDISTSSINSDDSKAQLESVIKQINEWGRALSNEARSNVYNDTSGTPRIIIGVLPDGETGIVVSKEGTNVLSLFN